MSNNNYNSNNNNNNNNRGKKSWYGNKPPWFRKNNWNNNKNKNQNNQNGDNNFLGGNSEGSSNFGSNSNGNNSNGNRGGWRGGGRGGWRGGWRGGSNNNGSRGGGASGWKKNNSNNKLYDNLDEDVVDDEASNCFIFDSTVKTIDEFAHIVEDNNIDCPYKMWNLYFPRESFKPDSDKHQIIEKFLVVLKHLKHDINHIKSTGYFNIDYKELCSNEVLKEQIPNFSLDFPEQPELYLSTFSLATHQHIVIKYKELFEQFKNDKSSNASNTTINLDLYQDMPAFDKSPVPLIKIRIINFFPITKLKDFKAGSYDKFISVIGTVVKVSASKPLVTHMAFECIKCSTTFQCSLKLGIFKQPGRCANKTCQNKFFKPMPSHFMTKVIEWQRIKLQEAILDPRDNEAGRMPRNIECELTEDLNFTCAPGDLVTINGVVKALTIETLGIGRSNRDKCSFNYYINTNSVQSMSQSSNTEDETSGSQTLTSKSTQKSKVTKNKQVEFTRKDMQFFDEVKTHPNLFKLLVNSLCPSIFGHELIKAGLLLGLIGGSQKNSCDVAVRSDIHVLIVGDPGLGKSQLLKACSNVSPRGIYVCGNNTTTAGLTVSLCKESGDGDFGLEAGALLCANDGSCCIDEFDKMGNQQQTLLEAMEQQCISIAKGGIVCNLPCRTTVIAAANPVGGHYDKSKTVSENIKLSGPLLSRFDLLFILLDKPDIDHDYRLSSHIISLHTTSNMSANSSVSSRVSSLSRTTNSQSNTSLNSTSSTSNSSDSLANRLKLSHEDFDSINSEGLYDPIPPPLLRKFIMYAKKICEPKIGDGAAEILSNFYIKLRQEYRKENGYNPITMRQLESLTRLTQARAKSELRSICTEQDAKEVIEIMKASMVDYNENELSLLEMTTTSGGKPRKSITIKVFASMLETLANKKASKMFSFDEIKAVYENSNSNIKSIGNAKQLIDLLNNQNYLLNKGSNNYQLQC